MRAVVVGSCNADLTVYTDRIPVNGETVSGRRLVIGPGGHRFYPDEAWPVFAEIMKNL